MKNKKIEKPLVFKKLKIMSIMGYKMTKFNELKLIPKMKIRERRFYKCITQF